ncbi:hypothetical protein K437DRAFT_67083 [Tilletiaria anomala UBC 951]|uniref:Uncharacterized protein n=1 Tax=Tilletiaria anomala (strain ATCC 24038 / CBS 436.72 / UBC 951) TaxID=1037660 RepID=A0A066WH89_TILAU|nr:uncharacterized protein K437DRAFT_67083 [Tilletiaria anomala UBC 951]KDN50414.1 hypothetical protein K437DRAFT_67083 [Tilletiaria anomala UBC 951]
MPRGRPRKNPVVTSSDATSKNGDQASGAAAGASSCTSADASTTRQKEAGSWSSGTTPKGNSLDAQKASGSTTGVKPQMVESASHAFQGFFQARAASTSSPGGGSCNCTATLRILSDRMDRMQDELSAAINMLRSDLTVAMEAMHANRTSSGPSSNPFANLKRSALASPNRGSSSKSSAKRARISEPAPSTKGRPAAPLAFGASISKYPDGAEEGSEFGLSIPRVSTIEDVWSQWTIGDESLRAPLKDWTTQMIAECPQKMVYYQRRQLCQELERLGGDIEQFKAIHGNTLTGAADSVRRKCIEAGTTKRRSRKSAAADADDANTSLTHSGTGAKASTYGEDDENDDSDEDERVSMMATATADRAVQQHQQRTQQQQHQQPQQQQRQQAPILSPQAQQTSTSQYHSSGMHHFQPNSSATNAAMAAQSLLGPPRLPGVGHHSGHQPTSPHLPSLTQQVHQQQQQPPHYGSHHHQQSHQVSHHGGGSSLTSYYANPGSGAGGHHHNQYHTGTF